MAQQADVELIERSDGDSRQAFRADVLRGLSLRQKAVPARWLYDWTGSELFEEITALPEYYPTRTETALLEAHGSEVADFTGKGRVVVEFGSGSSIKTPILLRAIRPFAYVPIDISGDFLRQATQELGARFAGMPILPIEADFMKPVTLPSSLHGRPMLGFFPGSTIGNMVPFGAVDLLRSMRRTLGEDAQLLIGFDRVKDISRLVAAYDDAQGVTARFNLNLLERINRELEGSIPVGLFRHVAMWNADWGRIEMHLEAQADLSFEVAGRLVFMRGGDTIHTENSHKYRPAEARLLLAAGGWTQLADWTDPGEDFLIVLAQAAGDHFAP